MSPADWISELEPAPPDDLATAMRSTLKDSTSNPSAEELLQAAERFCNPISVWRGVLGKTAGPLQLQSPARSARPLRPKPPAGSVQLQPIEVKT